MLSRPFDALRQLALHSFATATLVALSVPEPADPQCSATPPPPPVISAATITAAKDLVKQWTSATPAQAAKIDSIPVVQERGGARAAGKPSDLAEVKWPWFGPPRVILYWDPTLSVAGLTPADAGSDAAIAVVAVILWHELFHLTDGETGGLGGPGAGGVPAGTDCKHFGLQWSGAMRACEQAQAAAPGSQKRAALCALFRGSLGPLKDHAGLVRQCKVDGHPNPSPPGSGGPPSWGFPNAPWTSLCEACP